MTASAPPKRRSLFTRLLLLLIVVIVLLGATNLAMIGVRALDRPAQPASGQLLYASTFDAYNENWYQYESQVTAKIADSQLRLSVDKSNDGIFSVLDYDFSDIDVRVNTYWIAAPSANNSVGVLFRLVDSENYYFFKIVDTFKPDYGTGGYCVERVKEGKREELSQCHPSSAILIGPNTVNQLRIVAKGRSFQFFVNDILLPLCPKLPQYKLSTWAGPQSDRCVSNDGPTTSTLIDEVFEHGKIALGLYASSPGTAVAFDNVLVYGP
jgi:hypothetical protein